MGGHGGNGGNGGSGGGIYNTGTLLLTNSTVSQNAAANGDSGGSGGSPGGGGSGGSGGQGGPGAPNGNPGNAGPPMPGGMAGYGGNGGNGSGIYNTGTLTLHHVTISYNGSGGFGGPGRNGMGDRGAPAAVNNNGAIAVEDSILAGNAQEPEGDCAGANVTSLGYNLVQNDACGFATDPTTILGQPPGLGLLADNGGATWTHAILTTSLAIDYIPLGVNGCLAGSSKDQRNARRRQRRGRRRTGVRHRRLRAERDVRSGSRRPGVYTLGQAVIQVDTPGTLTSLTVVHTIGDHPGRTGDWSVNGVGWGQYWSFTPNTGASGFSVTLTLPADFVPDADDTLCRYIGSGWDCAASSFDPVNQTITRSGVTGFSDWAIGHNTPSSPVLAIQRAGSDVVLTWTTVGSASYEVWYSANDPCFTPGTSCEGVDCATVTDTTWTHAGVAGNVNDNYSYVVIAVTAGGRSGTSNHVGAFGFSLMPGSE